jgi:hypothetical protein
MKLALLLCALILSTHVWAAAGNPAQRTSRLAIQRTQTAEETNSQPQSSKAPTNTVLFGWLILAWLAALVSWTMAEKSSLDKIMKEVLQAIARHS